ncbi:hypothetical protein N431DRAFT_460622 [Stipitochalara longipes BDJ]|nr:hypothetical protein N431DRAFT_460622 [Stipitochalara longipes BDJ]
MIQLGLNKTLNSYASIGNKDFGAGPAVLDEESDLLLCPETQCNEKFVNIENLVSHLVEQTMGTGYRKTRSTENTLEAVKKADDPRACVICGTSFAESIRNKRTPIKNHIDRHFPERFTCGGGCGNGECKFVGSSSQSIVEHKLQVKAPHKCPCCKRRFTFHNQLDKHIEEAHVQQYQVVAFAAKAGYDTTLFANTERSWTVDKPEPNLNLADVRLEMAKSVAQALIATRKPQKEVVVTWEHVEDSIGGRTEGRATSCDACRAAWKPCIHRFDQRAPMVVREGLVMKTRCKRCKDLDLHCKHTHEPSPSCEHCGIDCSMCTHE